METKTINIDLEVYKAIENLRQNFKETPNEILRRTLLQLKSSKEGAPTKGVTGKGGLRIRDGVYLPAGTQLRHIAKRSGDRYDAEVIDGGIRFGGKTYHSPSKAAIAAAGSSRNGWIFWEYFDVNKQHWALLDTLRGNAQG